jgi:hypothetical protein
MFVRARQELKESAIDRHASIVLRDVRDCCAQAGVAGNV